MGNYRRASAFGLALVFLGVGIPYLMWRSETRGRFLFVANEIERGMSMARGVEGPPSDEEVRADILALAESRSVRIEGLEVSHEITVEPVATGEPLAMGVAAYTLRGTMFTESHGIETSAPLEGVLEMQFGVPAPTEADR